jgi:hypothetical protein
MERVAGVKVLRGVKYLKISWVGWAAEHDTWEPASRIRRDTSQEHVLRMLHEYSSAPRLAAAEA